MEFISHSLTLFCAFLRMEYSRTSKSVDTIYENQRDDVFYLIVLHLFEGLVSVTSYKCRIKPITIISSSLCNNYIIALEIHKNFAVLVCITFPSKQPITGSGSLLITTFLKFISCFSVKLIRITNDGSNCHRTSSAFRLLSVCGDWILLQIQLRRYIFPLYQYFDPHI